MIRIATVEDIIIIKSINNQCLPENYDYNTYENFLTIYNMTYVFIDNSNIVGYIIGSIEDGVEAHIVSIAVLPDFRKKGFGQRLILALLVDAKKRNLKSCSLHVRVSNDAISIYKRLGFQPIREIEKYYHDGENGFLMRRKLK